MRAHSSTGWTSGAVTYDSGLKAHRYNRPAPRCSALLSGLLEVIPHLVPSPVAFSKTDRARLVHSFESAGQPNAHGLQHNHARYGAINRLNGMTGPNSQTPVSGVTYGAASQVSQLNAASFTETSTYNANPQLGSLVSGPYHYSYNYSATQNNGRIQSLSDVASGETITYQYDALNRLIQASGAGDPQGAWSQSFTLDGFGALLNARPISPCS